MKNAAKPTAHIVSSLHDECWPALPFDEWKDTCTTLHMWTQVVGKIRLARAPLINHWWQVPLYVTSRGLTTSPIPDNGQSFQIDFDFIAHQLKISMSDGRMESFMMTSRPVAAFYEEVMDRLRALGIDIKISTLPVEIADPIPFEADQAHATYDADYVNRFWRALRTADQLFTTFRSHFIGKVSPVHFFWGSFDLAVTRFSGRPAPPHPSSPYVADSITREAYSHEVSSCGFWPGNGGFGQAAFYAYAYPEPSGFADAQCRPSSAYYSKELGECLLPYEAARLSTDPENAVLDFCQSTYEAAANAAGWNRQALERTPIPRNR
jgi:hypothetical protein